MTNLNNRQLTFIDLFAGCGGLSEGFLNSGGFKGLAHVEWELPMVNTLRGRLEKKWGHTAEEAAKRVVHFDIQRSEELLFGFTDETSLNAFGKTNDPSVVSEGLRGVVGKTRVDLIIGGPPCQAYSIAGRAQDPNSMKDDYRNYLFESFVKVVEEFQPNIFVFENVPGLLSAKPGGIPVTKRIFNAFQSAGYTIRTPEKQNLSVFNSASFGVPQRRKRVIIIGVRNGSDADLEMIYSALTDLESKEEMTVREAIGHLAAYRPLHEAIRIDGKNVSHELAAKENKVQNHLPRFHNIRDIEIFKKWIRHGMNQKPNEEKIDFYNSLMGKFSNHAKYRNLEWEKPAPTIVAHLHKDGLMFIHPEESQARSITVREAALLQSFPEDFEFYGSQGSAYKMIGNAVPPKFAEMIAKAIINTMSKV